MKRVIVTGASGFVGGHTLAHLLARGYEVHAIGRTPLTTADVAWHNCDLADQDAVAALLKAIRATHLLHCAWYVEHGSFWSAPENVAWVARSCALATAFREAGGERLTVAGTCAEYDLAGGWLTERTSNCAPHTLYGASKDALRRVLEAFSHQSGLSLGWGRIFFPFGPSDGPKKLLSSVIDAMASGREAPCSEGSQIRDFLFVDDVANALCALLDSGVEGPVNICSGVPRSVRSVVTEVAETMNTTHLLRIGTLSTGEQPPLIVGNPARLRDEVGFRPQWSFEASLRETIHGRSQTAPSGT